MATFWVIPEMMLSWHSAVGPFRGQDQRHKRVLSDWLTLLLILFHQAQVALQALSEAQRP